MKDKDYKLEDGFTDKDFPKEISEKMIKSGINPIAGFLEGNSEGNYYCNFCLLNREDNYYSLDNEFLRGIFIPAWSCEQLWDYLEENHLLGYFITAFSFGTNMAFVINQDRVPQDKDSTILPSFTGKFSSLSVPVRMLIELHKGGLLI